MQLKVELKLIPDLIISNKELTGTPSKVTNIRIFCAIMNANPAAKTMCSELHPLLKLYMTVPITTATAERTFSTMTIKSKTYLQSSMTQNHALLLNAHKSRVDSLDLLKIVQ